MTQKEILDGNTLIAEFIGLSFCNKYMYEGWYTNKEHNHRICDYNGLKYHISWNELMPVIGKISNECEEPEELDGLKDALLCNDIKTAWKFVVSYIESKT